MKALNKLVKIIGYIGIYLLLFFADYLIAFVSSGAVMSIICSIYSFFSPLPYVASHRYGVLLLLISVLPAIIFFISSVRKLNKK